MGKWICKNCGSENIEIKAWVKVNTEKIADFSEDLRIAEDGDTWCNNCETHSGIEQTKEG